MPCSIPPEIFDLIVGWLRNEPTTLEACCLVSKSWVPRTRRYLFASIHFFEPRSSILSWMKVFSNPSGSPAQYTRNLTISEPLNAESSWIRSFHHVEKLTVYTVWFEDSSEVSLVQLHGLSPSLESLCLSHRSLPLSDVFTLACSSSARLQFSYFSFFTFLNLPVLYSQPANSLFLQLIFMTRGMEFQNKAISNV